MIAMPSLAKRPSNWWTSALAATSMPRVGSSTIRILGSSASQRQHHLLLVAARDSARAGREWPCECWASPRSARPDRARPARQPRRPSARGRRARSARYCCAPRARGTGPAACDPQARADAGADHPAGERIATSDRRSGRCRSGTCHRRRWRARARSARAHEAGDREDFARRTDRSTRSRTTACRLCLVPRRQSFVSSTTVQLRARASGVNSCGRAADHHRIRSSTERLSATARCRPAGRRAAPSPGRRADHLVEPMGDEDDAQP